MPESSGRGAVTRGAENAPHDQREWLGSITPPTPTLMVEVAAAEGRPARPGRNWRWRHCCDARRPRTAGSPLTVRPGQLGRVTPGAWRAEASPPHAATGPGQHGQRYVTHIGQPTVAGFLRVRLRPKVHDAGRGQQGRPEWICILGVITPTVLDPPGAVADQVPTGRGGTA